MRLLSLLLLFSHLFASPRLILTLEALSELQLKNISYKTYDRIDQEVMEELKSNDSGLVLVKHPPLDLDEVARRLFYDTLTLSGDEKKQERLLKDKLKMLPQSQEDLPQISPELRGEFYHLLMQVDKIFNQNQIHYWGVSGTLLGAIRHKGMVPWDDDVDLMCLYSDKQKIESLAPILLRHGLMLVFHHFIYKICPIKGQKVFQKNGKPYPWRYPFIDIFLVRKFKDRFCRVMINNPNLINFPDLNGRTEWYLLEDALHFPIRRVKFGPMKLPIPRYSKRILDREYGSDWNEIAYVEYCHSLETPVRSIKVKLTDRSEPPYQLPASNRK